MMLKKHGLLFLLVIFGCFSGISANSANLAGLRHISTEQRLNQNTVNQFYQDNRGYVWIATNSGLNRFDGESMLSLNDPNNHINSTPVSSLAQDSQNNLWISTYQGLAFVSHDQSINHLSKFPSQEKNQINANMVIGSEESTSQNRWVFTWNGVYQYQLKGQDITQPDSMALFHSQENKLLSYEKDGDVFWLGTNQGLFLFDSKELSLDRMTLISKNSLLPQRLNLKINAIETISDSQLIISSNKGLFLIDKNDFNSVTIKKITDGFISDVIFNSGLVYFATFGEIKSFEPATLKISTVFSLPLPPSQHSSYKIKTIFIDSNQLLWIGTQNQGAFVWNTKKTAFESWIANNKHSDLKLLDNDVWTIKHAQQGGLWIGTNAGLDYFNSEKNKIKPIVHNRLANTTIENLKIYDLLETQNSLWLATGNGLLNYHKGSKTVGQFFPHFHKANTPLVIFSLISIKPQEIWIASNIGILKFNTTTHEFSYDKNIMSPFNAKPARLIKFENNLLWIGLYDRLITYSPEKKKIKTIMMSERNAKGVYSILTDINVINQQLWLSYAHDGIYVIDLKNNNNIIKHFHSSNGFIDNMIYSIQNSHGYIWASSTQGLIRINQLNFEYVLFNHQDGLTSNEFNEGVSEKAENGALIFGGSKGLIKFHPNQIGKIKHINQPIISSIEIFSDSNQSKRFLNLDDRISIQNHKDIVYISFSTLDFLLPNNWQYEYWLEGEKKTKPRITKYPQATLTNLPTGNSVFNLRTISVKDSDVSETTQLSIMVTDTAPFTIPKTFSNYAIAIIILLLFFYRRILAKRKSLALYNQLEESEERMELALFDDRRGIWDCFIDEKDIGKSAFIVYQNKRDPLKLTLDKHFEIIHPEDIEHAKEIWEKFATGKQSDFFETYRSFFYQRWVWNRIYGKVNEYYPSGHPKRATGIWTDINPEKRIEDKLNLYSHAFQSTQDIVFILDNDLIVTVVNQAYETSTGYSCEKIIGKSMVDIAFSRFTEKETEQIKKQVQKNKRWHGESSVPRRNASSFPVDIRTNVITKNNIDTGYVVVMTDVSQLKSSIKPSLKNSFYDHMTGLPNKTLAFDKLRQLLRRCKTKKRQLSIIFLSIDHLDHLDSILENDSIDELITRVCNRLLPYMQKNDVFARYEQNTFIIIFSHSSDDSDILHTINQLLKEISKPFLFDDRTIEITASAGISSYPNDGENWSELITKAETALAQTQQQGKNLFKYYHEDSNKKALEKISLENRLSRAIQTSELFLVFQPTLELDTMKTVELDVKLRWKMEDNRIVYPSQFIPIAEKLGMVGTLSNWLIIQSFIALNRWNQEGMNISLNINLSASYLLENGTFDFIREKVTSYNINPDTIFIAINEDDIGDKTMKLIDVFEQLNSVGIHLVLDDFGKNIASIQNLQKFNFHSIKFDRILTRNIDKGNLNNDVLRGIISLVNNVQLGTVAKGIETEEQHEYLVRHKCRYGQGFLFSDPLIENQMRQYLLDKH